GSDGDAAADAVSGLGSDPAAAVRSVWESGAAAASGATGPSVAPLRRSPNGVAGQQITAPPVAGHAPARATEAITAPADAAPAATPAAVADQIRPAGTGGPATGPTLSTTRSGPAPSARSVRPPPDGSICCCRCERSTGEHRSDDQRGGPDGVGHHPVHGDRPDRRGHHPDRPADE